MLLGEINLDTGTRDGQLIGAVKIRTSLHLVLQTRDARLIVTMYLLGSRKGSSKGFVLQLTEI